ncbi:MAG: SPOR domain-containing protein [Salinibacter sp.]|uniref:SPOR domain-containing protein n=1 Tax=Salinibacter sp. TaxID=2065818 RepID=UPI0035D4F51B
MEVRTDSFRVQLFASTKRAGAESFRSEVRRWWSRVKGQAPIGVFGTDPVLAIRYDGTYHQVLMGGFAVRSEAQQGRAFLRRRYPDAFIVRTGGAGDTRTAGGIDAQQADSARARSQDPSSPRGSSDTTSQQSDLPDSMGIDPEAAWTRIRKAAGLVETLSRDSVYSAEDLPEIFDVNCSPVRPGQARSEALAREASHLNRNLGIDLEARYGRETRPTTGPFASSLSGTYVGVDWDLLSRGLWGNRQRSNLLRARAKAERLSGTLAYIQRTETCRARRIQERLRGMLPRLLKTEVRLSTHRKRLLRRAYLEGDALLDDFVEAKEETEEARQRLRSLREDLKGKPRPDPLKAFPPLPGLEFDSLSLASTGDSLRRRLGEAERRMVSLRDDAALDTRLSVFGRYTTTRTFNDRDFEFGLRVSQPLFGALFGNDEVAEAERAEVQRREEALALTEQRGRLKTVRRRFEEDRGRAIRAHHRVVRRRERVRRRLSARAVRGSQRLGPALKEIGDLLSATTEKVLAYAEVYEEVARAFSAAREPFDPAFLTPRPVMSYEQRARAGQRSVYVRSRQFRRQSNDFLIELAQARKIGRLIVSAEPDTPMKKLRALQEQTRENDLKVELLLAPDHWVRSGGIQRAEARLDTLDLRGSALHLDVEPHVLDTSGQRRDELVQRCLELLRTARRTIDGGRLVVSVPLSLPARAYREMAKIVDRAYLRAYGESQTHERAKEILKAARHFDPRQRVIALRPEDFAGAWELNQAISALQKTTRTDRFALQDLESFLQLVNYNP